MSDLVERLRQWSVFGYGYEASCTMNEAAARIERLEAALRPFAGYTNSEEYIKSGPDDGWCAAISYQVKHYREARAALKEGK